MFFAEQVCGIFDPTAKEQSMNRVLALILAGLVGLVSLTGCETMEGFGRDVEKTGDKIEDAADR
jgi:entericidin A